MEKIFVLSIVVVCMALLIKKMVNMFRGDHGECACDCSLSLKKKTHQKENSGERDE